MGNPYLLHRLWKWNIFWELTSFRRFIIANFYEFTSELDTPCRPLSLTLEDCNSPLLLCTLTLMHFLTFKLFFFSDKTLSLKKAEKQKSTKRWNHFKGPHFCNHHPRNSLIHLLTFRVFTILKKLEIIHFQLHLDLVFLIFF